MTKKIKDITIIDKEGNIIYKGTNRRVSTNGNGKLIFYLLTVFIGIVVTAVFVWANNINGKIKDYDTVVINRGERLATLESNFKTVCEQLIKIDITLTKLDSKVDILVTDLAVEKSQKSSKLDFK